MKNKNLKKFVIPTLFLVFILFSARIPALAEWYMQTCYPTIAVVLSFFSRWTPFSLFDWMIIAAIVVLLGSIVKMCKRRLSLRRWSNLLVLSIFWIVIWFYLSWGIAYFRYDFYERFGVEQPTEDRDFFEMFVENYIFLLNKAYMEAPIFFDTKEVDAEIEYLYEKHRELLQLPHRSGWRRTKITLLEPLMTRMGVAGYFAPFFNEIHVNNFSLPISYPYTLAHEKAHQFGIASEAECNLFATVICTASEHPLVRYSGYLQTTSYLLGNLRKISPERYREISEKIDPRIIADYRAIREHWQQGVNPTLSAMQEKVYDTYLKTNRQQSGVLSYSEMTGLLVAFFLKFNY